MIDNGERLARPMSSKMALVECPEKLYDMMLSCWNLVKHSRPRFCQILDFLGDYYQETDMHNKNEEDGDGEDEAG